MTRNALFLLLTSAAWTVVSPAQEEIVFHSDVSQVRVDAQVVDGSNRAITGLRMEDFVLREDGHPQPIRGFGSENMPVDVLLVLDVSASMRPHVQRIADASGQALTVLGKDDRMGIMVFDRSARIRLALSSNRDQVRREFDRLLQQERFNGGTDITRAMLDAANYLRREGRRDARKAIVILTDDETEFERDDAGVSRALARADTVMCALIAPDEMQSRGQRRGGYPGGGGGYPGGAGGGGVGGTLGGIILGRGGYPRGGNGGPAGQGGGGFHTKSAGTSEIARDSGGDSMSVDDASALEETLSRLRQRYTLYFNLPEGVSPGQERNIDVDLSAAARRRYRDAEIRYRRASQTSSDDRSPTLVRHAHDEPAASGVASDSPAGDDLPVIRRRRVAVNSDGTPIENSTGDAPPPAQQSGPITQTPAPTQASPSTSAPSSGGWRRVDPGQK